MRRAAREKWDEPQSQSEKRTIGSREKGYGARPMTCDRESITSKITITSTRAEGGPDLLGGENEKEKENEKDHRHFG
jgi:hypothetical protein